MLFSAPPSKQPDLTVLYKQTGFAETVTLERPREWFISSYYFVLLYRVADKSLARTERKQINVSVRMERISFGALPCRKTKKNLMTARVSMLLVRVPDMLPRLFPSWSG